MFSQFTKSPQAAPPPSAALGMQPPVRINQYPPTRVTVEKKVPDPGPPDDEGEMVCTTDDQDVKRPLGLEKPLSSSVFLPGKTYRFRLTRTAAITTSGAGALSLATSIMPSQFTQYTALLALFTESRLISTRIQWVMQGTSKIVPFAFAFYPTWVSGSPSLTFTDIISIPGVKLTNIDRPIVPVRKSEWHAKPARNFSAITNASGVDPVGGNIGAWVYAVSTAADASTDIATYLIECDYEFRSRLS